MGAAAATLAWLTENLQHRQHRWRGGDEHSTGLPYSDGPLRAQKHAPRFRHFEQRRRSMLRVIHKYGRPYQSDI